jgi:hypothetical protein
MLLRILEGGLMFSLHFLNIYLRKYFYPNPTVSMSMLFLAVPAAKKLFDIHSTNQQIQLEYWGIFFFARNLIIMA